jgi:hypothetical protein
LNSTQLEVELYIFSTRFESNYTYFQFDSTRVELKSSQFDSTHQELELDVKISNDPSDRVIFAFSANAVGPYGIIIGPALPHQQTHRRRKFTPKNQYHLQLNGVKGTHGSLTFNISVVVLQLSLTNSSMESQINVFATPPTKAKNFWKSQWFSSRILIGHLLEVSAPRATFLSSVLLQLPSSGSSYPCPLLALGLQALRRTYLSIAKVLSIVASWKDPMVAFSSSSHEIWSEPLGHRYVDCT